MAQGGGIEDWYRLPKVTRGLTAVGAAVLVQLGLDPERWARSSRCGG